MSNDDLVIKKLNTIIALLAIQGQEDNKKVNILKSLGFTYQEISNLTSIPSGTLKWRAHDKRKKQK